MIAHRHSGAQRASEAHAGPRIAVLLAILLACPVALAAWHGFVPALSMIVHAIESVLHAVAWVLVTLLVAGGLL